MDNGPEITTYENQTIGVYGGKFYPPHLGHVSFALEAAKQVDVLFIVIQYDEEHEKTLIKNTNFQHITPLLRERWLTETFKNHPNIRVTRQYEHRTPDHLTNPSIKQTYDELREITGHVNIIFSNTHEYDEYFQKWLPEAEHRIFLENREIYPISATQIREQGPYKNWEYLPEPVQNYYLKRIAFCGWESAGKSYTTQHIAKKYDTTYLPEYGRTYYVDELGGYADIALPEDYINIMSGHLQQLRYATGNKFTCVDTDLIYTQFFYQQIYGTLNPILDQVIKQNIEKIDTHIFLEPYTFDDDGTRYRYTDEERQKTNQELKNLYHHYGKKLHIINGTGEERIQKITTLIDNLTNQ